MTSQSRTHTLTCTQLHSCTLDMLHAHLGFQVVAQLRVFEGIAEVQDLVCKHEDMCKCAQSELDQMPTSNHANTPTGTDTHTHTNTHTYTHTAAHVHHLWRQPCFIFLPILLPPPLTVCPRQFCACSDAPSRSRILHMRFEPV
jgi:hypothetical protein